MKIERAVTVNVEAAHCDTDGKLHGHSYLVECWTAQSCCLVSFEQSVREAAKCVDHTVLESSIGKPTMEALGEWFLRRDYVLVGCPPLRLSRVIVRRPTLGYVVEVSA